MRYLLTTLSLIFVTVLSAQIISTTQKSKWINDIKPSDKTILDGSSAYQYLLIDLQDNLKKQEMFKHYAIKILNSDGIQSISDISTSYDPSYQKLVFHQLKIIRGDKEINKLAETEIKTFQRETSMERSFYDGSLTAVANLTDVRVDDIIEYSYSIKGFNPIKKGNYSQVFYHQFTIPINRVYNRVITTPEKDLYSKEFAAALQPQRKSSEGLLEYIWDTSAKDFKLYDNNVPIWFDTHSRVNVSTHSSWSEVVDLIIPHYEIDLPKLKHINEQIKTGSSFQGQSALSLIQAVQDEIRYLGFESGINGYKPTDPLKVFEQKYGDCKDKSLLLVALLRNEGLESYPVLVNTQMRNEVNSLLPSLSAFDHCIVKFSLDGKEYFVDPTLSNQGGNLDDFYFPNYRKGLELKKGNSSLIDLPQPKVPKIKVKDVISVNEIGGNAQMFVRTEYTGSRADYMRAYFNTSSKESIQKEYLNFYSNLYPRIESVSEVKYFDNDRYTTNLFVIEEYYSIEGMWKDQEGENYQYIELYPLILESMTNYGKSAQRDMPYYMGEPFVYTQNTTVELPENWNIESSDEQVSGDGFYYENVNRGSGKQVNVLHKYELSKEYIESGQVELMLDKHRKIRENFSYFLSYQKSASGFQLSWISILITLISIGFGSFYALKLNREYNPVTWEYAEDKPIGSWLILPALGIVISPFLLAYQLFSEEYFSQSIWDSFFSNGGSVTIELGLIVIFELIYNNLILIFSLLVLFQFFSRRTSTPVLISCFYLVSFVGPLVDMLLVEFYTSMSGFDEADTRNLIRSFFAAAIWIPYFKYAERVKSTFCKQKI